MLDGLLSRNNFKTKCKSAVTRTKTRLELIKKKRSATQKFLKDDIAELLKNNLYRHAYARAEGLYMEMNLSSCYSFLDECCNCIMDHLKEMHQQRECPEECKLAAASLIYAAARFADLPELRDLRALINDKYGKSLEPYVSEEFVEKLKSKPPKLEMKLQLMQDIAKEFGVPWDPKSLEQQLQSPSLTAQDLNLARSRSTVVRGKEKQDSSCEEGSSLLRHSRSSRGDASHKARGQYYYRNDPKTPLSSRSASKGNDNRKLYTVGSIGAPYTTHDKSRRKEEQNDQNVERDVGTKPRPRSVITKLFRQTQSAVRSGSEQDTHVKEPQNATAKGDKEMEPKNTNGLLVNYSKRESPSVATLSVNSNNGEAVSQDLPLPPWRRRYLFPQSQQASLLKEANEIIANLS